MKITYDILQNLLKCNKGMKLVFRDNSNILDVYLFSDIILSLNLNINNIINIICNHIINNCDCSDILVTSIIYFQSPFYNIILLLTMILHILLIDTPMTTFL